MAEEIVIPKSVQAIIWSAIISSCLVLLTSYCIYDVMLEEATFTQVLQTPFGGIIGKSFFRFSGRYNSVVSGLVFNFIFCLLFSIGYFFFIKIYRYDKYPFLNGLLYGLCLALLIMFIVRPVSGWEKAAWSKDGLNIILFVISVGLPNGIIRNYYNALIHDK